MKNLYLLRGLPGAGKSTLAKTLLAASLPSAAHFEADMFFINLKGEYVFSPSKLSDAHDWCRARVFEEMVKGINTIIVSNTLTTENELTPFLDMAEHFKYRVTSLIVENRHGGKSIHDVPSETIERMNARFTRKLM